MEKCDKCGEFIAFARLCPLCAHYEKERFKRSVKKCEERAKKAEALAREFAECLDVMFSQVPMSVWLEAKIQLEELHGKAKEVLGDEV